MLVRILFTAVALACALPAAAQPIKIGAFLSVTGPAAFLGDPEQKTLELYVEKLNAGGGLLGRRLELEDELACVTVRQDIERPAGDGQGQGRGCAGKSERSPD